MCGIIGYLGKNNAVDYLLNGLKSLEYRGYDSCGIALKKEQIDIYKSLNKVKHLKEEIKGEYAEIGIGHTRWATHGKPSINNAHPHISYHKKFVIVHNGIIENYLEIKEKYLKNIKLYSQTDTEVLVNLIEIMYKNDVLSTLIDIKKIIKGSYAFVLIYLEENRLYFMKNQTPLVICDKDNEFFLSSDSIGFPSFIKKQIILEDGDYGYIDDKSINLFNNGKEKEIIYKDIVLEEKMVDYNKFSYHMEKEIYDQPKMILKLFNYFLDNNINQIKQKIKESDSVYLVGCGSSYYSSNIGKNYIEKYLKKNVKVILASEAIYQLPLLSKNPYFIFISQSGETLDIINLIKLIKKYNIKTLAITNSVNSSITYLTDDVIYIQAGRELSVASTKAFLGQSLSFLLLCKKIEKEKITFFINEINNILNNLDKIKTISKELTKYKDVFYLGRNIDYYIALESSLKLKEISYIHAEAFPAGELKHGTLALIDNSCAVIGLISQNNISSIMRTNIMETKSRGGNTFIISSKNVSNENDDIIINDIDDDLTPLLILIVCQLLAFYTSLYKGNEIDTPRNLAKSVTVE